MTLAITSTVGNSLATALAGQIGAGSIIEIRTGAKPGPGVAATGTLLCSITVTGSFTATGNSISAGDPATQLPVANGTAGHFRLKTSGGTAVLEGDITDLAGNGDLKLTTTAVATTTPVDLGVPTFTVPLT
jgi:hypothetical protein